MPGEYPLRAAPLRMVATNSRRRPEQYEVSPTAVRTILASDQLFSDFLLVD